MTDSRDTHEILVDAHKVQLKTEVYSAIASAAMSGTGVIAAMYEYMDGSPFWCVANSVYAATAGYWTVKSAKEATHSIDALINAQHIKTAADLNGLSL